MKNKNVPKEEVISSIALAIILTLIGVIATNLDLFGLQGLGYVLERIPYWLGFLCFLIFIRLLALALDWAICSKKGIKEEKKFEEEGFEEEEEGFEEEEEGFEEEEEEESYKNDMYYARILCLSGKVTFLDIKKSYYKLMKAYHPDKLDSMGEKLKLLAVEETKKINEAYDYFKNKYSK